MKADTTTTAMTTLNEFMQHHIERIENHLAQILPSEQTQPQTLHQAMRYASLGNGKRLRPLLVYATGLCFTNQSTQLDNAAAAVELIHCYSLVHDDLPCMDDDDLRRGKASCHRAFDEATAVLVGDALQSLAFTCLAQPTQLLNAEQQLKMIDTLADATGSLGMAGGQGLELQLASQKIDQNTQETIDLLKTGALIRASVRLGALAANCQHAATLQQLDQFARYIGIAFQIQDDILDNQADSNASIRVQQLYQLALSALKEIPQNTQRLAEFSEKLVVRSI